MKPLILIGSAPCVRNDIKEALRIVGEADFMAIGLDAADKYNGEIIGCVTYEPRDLPAFKEIRRKMGFISPVPTYSQERFKHEVDFVFPELEAPQPHKDGWSGSSALLGVKVGLRLGYEKIILCGCPLDVQKYAFFRRGWTFIYDMIKYNVRSMSGWTRELLGIPTPEWIQGFIKKRHLHTDEPLSFRRLSYSCDPEMLIVGGPLFIGFQHLLNGEFEEAKKVFVRHYKETYMSIPFENTTHFFVEMEYSVRRIPLPESRKDVINSILVKSCEERFMKHVIPIFDSITKNGWCLTHGPIILLRRMQDKILVTDGRHRCSLLSAMGWENLEVYRL